MDSCTSWSPPSLSPEALPALDLILPSVLQESTGGFCAKEEEAEEDGDGFSSGLSNETFSLSSHLGASPQSSNSLLHDSKSVAKKLAQEDTFLPQEDTFLLSSPIESTDGCRVAHIKRPKLDDYAAAPKAQAGLSQVPKLGEKITALQQLVSPFGKTDTASVLLEAIGYIKFLQEQVHVLSSPYMKASAGNNRKGSAVGMDLRSRGLCLVPVSCTMNVANSNGADYWISSISGCSQ